MRFTSRTAAFAAFVSLAAGGALAQQAPASPAPKAPPKSAPAAPAAPAAATPPPEPAKRCSLQKAADWKVREVGGVPLVDIEINGRKLWMQIDTGAPNTMIDGALATQLKFSRGPAQDMGDGRGEAAIIEEAKIGAINNTSWRVLVANHFLGNEISVVLGQDFFAEMAVEFDLPNKEIRLFYPQDCENTFLGYWPDQNLRHVSLEAGTKATVRAELNGQGLDAVVDSGAQTSVVTKSRAERLGALKGETTAGGCVTTFAKAPVDSVIAQFETFSLGPQLVRNPKIHVADLGAPAPQGGRMRSFGAIPEMIIGLDLLQSHRVLMVPAQRRLYYSYSSGTVFPARPTTPCKGK